MVKYILILLLVLAPICKADNDTLLMVKEYGFRCFGMLNIADTINGTAQLDSTDMIKSVKMAFSRISRSVTVPKAKNILTVDGQRSYLIDDALISFGSAYKGSKGVTKPLIRMYSGVENDGDYEDKMVAGDSVMYFKVWGDSIKFYPVPTFVDTIQVEYNGRPAHPDASGDTVYVPYEYKDAMIFLSCYHAELMREGSRPGVFWDQYIFVINDIVKKMILDRGEVKIAN